MRAHVLLVDDEEGPREALKFSLERKNKWWKITTAVGVDDARRVLAQLETRLHGVPAGSHIRIRCHPADETHTRGPYNRHIRTLRAAHGLAGVRISPDPALVRGQLVVQREDD